MARKRIRQPQKKWREIDFKSEVNRIRLRFGLTEQQITELIYRADQEIRSDLKHSHYVLDPLGYHVEAWPLEGPFGLDTLRKDAELLHVHEPDEWNCASAVTAVLNQELIQTMERLAEKVVSWR